MRKYGFMRTAWALSDIGPIRLYTAGGIPYSLVIVLSMKKRPQYIVRKGEFNWPPLFSLQRSGPDIAYAESSLRMQSCKGSLGS